MWMVLGQWIAGCIAGEIKHAVYSFCLCKDTQEFCEGGVPGYLFWNTFHSEPSSIDLNNALNFLTFIAIFSFSALLYFFSRWLIYLLFIILIFSGKVFEQTVKFHKSLPSCRHNESIPPFCAPTDYQYKWRIWLHLDSF